MNSSPKRIDEVAARAQFESAIKEYARDFETFFFAQFLGMKLDYLLHDVSDHDIEVCQLTFPVTDIVKNSQGALHGGAMAWAMDSAMGHLVNKVTGPCMTIDEDLKYAPVKEGTVRRR